MSNYKLQTKHKPKKSKNKCKNKLQPKPKPKQSKIMNQIGKNNPYARLGVTIPPWKMTVDVAKATILQYGGVAPKHPKNQKKYQQTEVTRVLNIALTAFKRKEKENVKVLKGIESMPVFCNLVRRYRATFDVNTLAQKTIDERSVGPITPRLIVELALTVELLCCMHSIFAL